MMTRPRGPLAACLLATLAVAAVPTQADEPTAPATTPPPAPPPAPKPPEWKGTVGAGLIVLTGNADTATFSSSASASRETFGWILSTKASAAYGEGRANHSAPSATTTLNGSLLLRLDRKLGDVWTVYTLGAVEGDHVASVELRTLGELGGAAQWLDVKEEDWQQVMLRTDLGLRWSHEERRAYYGATPGPLPTVKQLAPRLGLAFRWGFSKEVFLGEEAEVLPSVTGASRVLIKSVTRLSSRLTKAMTFGIGYSVAFDSRPAPGKVETDTGLTALLEVGF